MEWLWILVMVLAAPIILLPVAFIWYLNIAGIISAYKESREEETVIEKASKTATQKTRAKGSASG